MVTPDHSSFELLSRSCVSADAYFVKTLYIALSVVAIACVSVVLIRIVVKRLRQEPATSVGRLVEHLVMIQGA